MRASADSITTSLDEARRCSRYIHGLLVFLGLLGTFWGLIETVGSVGKVIEGLRVGGDAGQIFSALKDGLAAPLGGMGISFSSSLFGLAGSLVLGFLDLQIEPGAGALLHRSRGLALDHRARSEGIDTGARGAPAPLPAAAYASSAGPPALTSAGTLEIKAYPSTVLREVPRQLRIEQVAATNAGMANLAEGIQGLVRAHAQRAATDTRLGQAQAASRRARSSALLDVRARGGRRESVSWRSPRAPRR